MIDQNALQLFLDAKFDQERTEMHVDRLELCNRFSDLNAKLGTNC